MYTKLSRYISYLLRHNPGDLDLKMDSNGWVSCKELIDKIHKQGKYIINIDILKLIVKEDEKQRYAFSKDEKCIRANQGHSIDVNMEYTPVIPPDILYHGTDAKFVRNIMESGGLSPMTRQYVHLSQDVNTALGVALRHGNTPIIFHLNAKKMYEDGIKFYKSENNVYLCEHIPQYYLYQAQYYDSGELKNISEMNK